MIARGVYDPSMAKVYQNPGQSAMSGLELVELIQVLVSVLVVHEVSFVSHTGSLKVLSLDLHIFSTLYGTYFAPNL